MSEFEMQITVCPEYLYIYTESSLERMNHIVFPLPLHQTQYPEAKDKSQKKK